MIDYGSARDIVAQYLVTFERMLGYPLRIVDDQTEEYDWGWTIYWHAKDPAKATAEDDGERYLPFLVDRATGVSVKVGNPGPKMAYLHLVDLRVQKLREMGRSQASG